MIDLIIPVYNEEEFLRTHQKYYHDLGNRHSLIFVDGGSSDRTVEMASKFGKVVSSQKGRGVQKNRGAQAGEQQYLLFLHVDALASPDMIDQAVAALEQGADAGCFQMAIQDRRVIFRFFEWLVNFRAKVLGVTDGDLGLFIRREVFDQVGGFPEAAMMEDILIGRRLKKAKGQLQVLPQKINVSARKWDEQGFWSLMGKYVNAYWTLYCGKMN